MAVLRREWSQFEAFKARLSANTCMHWLAINAKIASLRTALTQRIARARATLTAEPKN